MHTNFYHVQPISQRIDAIFSATGEIMYLLKGTKKALLVDTCLGIGNLKEVVSQYTHLPLEVAVTHGHVDHAMGAPLFDHVYFNHLDDDLYRVSSPLSERQGYAAPWLAQHAKEDIYFVPKKDPSLYHNLKDGDVFDLGDLHVEAYALPGHTQGMMVLLVREERILITGDAANKSVFMFGPECTSIETYQKSLLQTAKRLEGLYDMCFMMHHEIYAPKTTLTDVAKVCDDIIHDRVDHVPYEFMGGHYLIAKKVNETFDRLDGSFGNIIYREDHIREVE